MTRPAVEVADILRAQGDRFLDRYRSSFDFQQHKAFRAIQCCRTAALGGHVDVCPQCGYQEISYNSCRNRSCPKVPDPSTRTLACSTRTGTLAHSLFHVVFTVPHELNVLALDNPRLFYVWPFPITDYWHSMTSRVTFRWKDYAHGGKQGQMTLLAVEFLRRFFLHVLPKAFVRVRHFGFLANRFRAARLPLCRQLLTDLSGTPVAPDTPSVACQDSFWHCPKCGTTMIVLQRLTAMAVSPCTSFDSS